MTRIPRRATVLATAALALAPAAAWAHADAAHPGGGFLAAFLHPISGLDHVVAMVAFPRVMALGGLLGLLGVPMPGVEIAIAVSGLVMGLMVLFALRPPLVKRQHGQQQQQQQQGGYTDHQQEFAEHRHLLTA